MRMLIAYLRAKPLTLLVLALPLAVLAEIGHWGEVWVFALSAIAVVPLASYIGEGTEALASRTNPRIGGLLNATLGNAAELIITIFAIREGLLELVKASITGSILGNLLLVLGASMVVGGVRHGVQTFDRRNASRNAILLVLAVLALLIPSILNHFTDAPEDIRVESLNLGVAAVMIVLYGLGLLYSFKYEGAPLAHAPTEQPIHGPAWSTRKALIVLALATGGVVIASELLVGAVEPVVEGLGVSEFFLGIILIPLIGNVAEHLVAVQVAARNHMESECGNRHCLQPADRPVRRSSAGVHQPAVWQPAAADIQSSGSAGAGGRGADHSPGLGGRRVKLAGGSRAAGDLRDAGAGVLLAAGVEVIIKSLWRTEIYFVVSSIRWFLLGRWALVCCWRWRRWVYCG